MSVGVVSRMLTSWFPLTVTVAEVEVSADLRLSGSFPLGPVRGSPLLSSLLSPLSGRRRVGLRKLWRRLQRRRVGWRR